MDLNVKGMRSTCTKLNAVRLFNNYVVTEIPWKQVFTFLNYYSCVYRIMKVINCIFYKSNTPSQSVTYTCGMRAK